MCKQNECGEFWKKQQEINDQGFDFHDSIRNVNNPLDSKMGEFCIGELTIKPDTNCIRFGEQDILLEPRLIKVLCVLALADGKVVERGVLLNSVWGNDQFSDEVLTKAISLLRSIFKKNFDKSDYIATVSKSGYRLTQPTKRIDEFRASDRRSAKTAGSTGSPDAQRYYLQGRSLNRRMNGDTVLPVALKLLKDAVHLDPDFAEAHAELANSYTLMATYMRGEAGQHNLNKTIEHARRAIALDPTLALPVILLAIAEFTLGNMNNAINLNIAALKLEPNNSEVVMRLGYFYSAIGLNKKAIPLLQKAIELDPVQGRNFQVLARAKMANGDLDEAEGLAKTAMELHNSFAFETYASIAFAQGKYELAAERISVGNSSTDKMFSEAFDADAWRQTARFAFSPKREERLFVASALVDLLGKYDTTPDVLLIQGLLRCGAAESFFSTMTSCLPVGRHGSYLSLWADIEPCRDIYNHPDFPVFAKHVGLEDAWNVHGIADRLVT